MAKMSLEVIRTKLPCAHKVLVNGCGRPVAGSSGYTWLSQGNLMEGDFFATIFAISVKVGLVFFALFLILKHKILPESSYSCFI